MNVLFLIFLITILVEHFTNCIAGNFCDHSLCRCTYIVLFHRYQRRQMIRHFSIVKLKRCVFLLT